MDTTTLISRLEAATSSFHNLERQLADPDVAADPQRLETIARERSRLEPLVLDYTSLQKVEAEQVQAKACSKKAVAMQPWKSWLNRSFKNSIATMPI